MLRVLLVETESGYPLRLARGLFLGPSVRESVGRCLLWQTWCPVPFLPLSPKRGLRLPPPWWHQSKTDASLKPLEHFQRS